MRSEEDLKPMLREAFNRIAKLIGAESSKLVENTSEGLERRSVLVSLDIDIAAMVLAGALIAGGPVNEGEIIDEVIRRTQRLMDKYDVASDALGSFSIRPTTPGNGTVN